MSQATESADTPPPQAGRRKNQAPTPLAIAGLIAAVAVAASLAAAAAVAASQALSFGEAAAYDAGEHPTREVSLRVETLMMRQDYVNAVSTGIALALVLLLASWGLNAIVRGGVRGAPGRPVRTSPAAVVVRIAVAVAVGGGCLALACFAFRMQQVGSQDLVTASLVHAFVWAGLGAVAAVATAGSPRSPVPAPVLAGGLWGVAFPTLVALVDRDVYVERLFATDGVIGVWAGVGCVVVLSAGLPARLRGRRTEDGKGDAAE